MRLPKGKPQHPTSPYPLDVDEKKLKEYLELFVRADVDRDGRLSEEEFCSLFAAFEGAPKLFQLCLQGQVSHYHFLLQPQHSDFHPRPPSAKTKDKSLTFEEFVLGMATAEAVPSPKALTSALSELSSKL